MPQTPLELRPIAVAAQRTELLDGGLDAALVRLPIDDDGLGLIRLYDEVTVVVVLRRFAPDGGRGARSSTIWPARS